MDDVNMPRPGKETRGYHHGDLKRALLAAAARILDAEGIDAVTIRAVARAAGVAHSAPANHFPDRRALLTALASDGFVQLAEAIGQAERASAPGRDARLLSFMAGAVGWALSHPNRYRLIFRGDAIDAADAGYRSAGDALYERLREGLKSPGATGGTSADTQTLTAWSLAHGYISLRLEGVLAMGADEISGEPRERAIARVLLAGLR